MNGLHTFITHASTAYALLRRDLKVLRTQVRGMVFDSALMLWIEALMFNKLFPLMGMPTLFIAPMYIGSCVFISFLITYNYGYTLCFDKESTKFVEYHLSLPIPKRWLFGEYIAYYCIKLFITTFPLFIFGMFFLPSGSIAHTVSVPYFLISYLLMILFLVSFFVMWAFMVSFQMFSDNLWHFVLEPTLILSALYVTWKATYAFAPRIATMLLCNPMTYVTEGLRSSLLGSVDYISTPLCMIVVILSCCGMWLLLGVGIRRTLDPV